jgi:hypothetical protein
MPIKFENSNEAFLSILSVVAGADSVGSIAERDYLFQTVKGLPGNGNLTNPEINQLLGQVTDKLHSALPQTDGAITSAGMEELFAAAKGQLTPELRQVVLKAAARLSETDETGADEAALLSQLRSAFA